MFRVRGKGRYTRQKNQTFEFQRHLLPLSRCCKRWFRHSSSSISSFGSFAIARYARHRSAAAGLSAALNLSRPPPAQSGFMRSRSARSIAIAPLVERAAADACRSRRSSFPWARSPGYRHGAWNGSARLRVLRPGRLSSSRCGASCARSGRRVLVVPRRKSGRTCFAKPSAPAAGC